MWRRQWHPTSVLLPRKSHGQRSLVGCSPWGRYESDTTERLHFHFSLSRNGGGNGNPLQCSCLENPRDGRAWWAAVYGVAQSRTRLKWLSSSSSSSSVSKDKLHSTCVRWEGSGQWVDTPVSHPFRELILKAFCACFSGGPEQLCNLICHFKLQYSDIWSYTRVNVIVKVFIK